MAAGADVNAKDDAFSGETPLHWAAERSQEIAELLIAKGAMRKVMVTGLLCMMRLNRKETIELLIAKGGCECECDDYGTPLDWAINGDKPLTGEELKAEGK